MQLNFQIQTPSIILILGEYIRRQFFPEIIKLQIFFEF